MPGKVQAGQLESVLADSDLRLKLQSRKPMKIIRYLSKNLRWKDCMENKLQKLGSGSFKVGQGSNKWAHLPMSRKETPKMIFSSST